MKLESVEHVGGTVVSARTAVTFSVERKSANELRQALAIVQRYEKAAVKAVQQEIHNDPRESDWHRFSFAVKNDKVVVTIEDGMAG